MKVLKTAKMLVVGMVATLSLTGYSATQEVVSINLNHVWVPKGFDSNDRTQVIVTGDLPNTCYLRPEGAAKIVNDRINIEMTATKVSGENANCIMALVPYMVAVDLGQLNEGHYNIFINAGTASERNSSIYVDHPGSSSINNFTYANVSHVQALPRQGKIILAGAHPSSCMEIERVEIIANDKNDTYSILPIVKANSPVCDQMIKPFTYAISIPQLAMDKQLLHIRKLDGTALNYMVVN